jgi:hypothetical protein
MRAPILATVALVALVAPARADEPPAPTRAHYKAAADNMKLIGLAYHNYASAYGDVWVDDVRDKAGKPLLSWRVALLPFVEEEKLFKQFKLDEPWDSANNKPLIAKMPKLYAPVRVTAKDGETFYQRFNGPGALFDGKPRYKIATIPDGTSNTGLVFEAGDPVIWSKPADLTYDAKKPLPKLGAHFSGMWCHVAMCDGAVIRVKKDADAKELRKLITPDDGEVLDTDKLTK